MESKLIASTLAQEVVGGEREIDKGRRQSPEAKVLGESSRMGWTGLEATGRNA